MIRGRVRIGLAALAALLMPGLPARGQGTAGEAPASPLEAGRPADDLLERPALQALVDAQVEQDGAALAAALTDPDPAVRARAAFGLASVQDPAAVTPLFEALADRDPRVRADAAFAVGLTADSTASSPLLAALGRETDRAVRQAILEALGKVGDRLSLDRLAALQVEAGDRGALALAIGRYGLRGIHDPAAVRRLVSLLPRNLGEALDSSEAVETSAKAAWYFARVQDTTAWAFAARDLRAALDARFLAQSARAATEAGSSEGSAVAASDGPAPALHLLPAIGRLGDPGDDERLVDWLESGADWRARAMAARALVGRTAREGVLEALRAGTHDPSIHVAVEAALAISAADSLPLDTGKSIAQRFMMNPLPWPVSAALAPAVVKGGGAAVVLLVVTGITGGRTADNLAHRAHLLEALGLDGGRPGWLVLRNEAGSENPRVAAAAIAGLGERWRRGYRSADASVEEYYRLFAAGLERKDLATTSAAAPLLADPLFRPLGATELLGRIYGELGAPHDIEPMIEIARALGQTGDPAAEPILREVLAAPHPVLRQTAAEALQALLGRPVLIPEVPHPPGRRIDWGFLRAMGPHPRLVLETEKGRIVVELDAEEAPLTVQTVLQFAQEGRYDGVSFHRVVPNFVVQGGDFERGDGYGGPGFAIRTELTRIPYGRGVIGMASAGKDTEGSQFFITHSPQPHLDGRYTAFGRMVQGMDVVDRIVEGDTVQSARVQVRAGSATGRRG